MSTQQNTKKRKLRLGTKVTLCVALVQIPFFALAALLHIHTMQQNYLTNIEWRAQALAQTLQARAADLSSYSPEMQRSLGLNVECQVLLERNAAEFGVTDTVFVNTHEEGLANLAEGDVDAYFNDQAILLAMIARSEDPTAFDLTERLFTYEPYAIGLPRGDEDFRLLVDRSVSQQLRSGHALSLFAQHVGRPDRAVRAFFMLSALPE